MSAASVFQPSTDRFFNFISIELNFLILDWPWVTFSVVAKLKITALNDQHFAIGNQDFLFEELKFDILYLKVKISHAFVKNYIIFCFKVDMSSLNKFRQFGI